MRAGRLRDRVTIQQPTVQRDAAGQEIKTWGTLCAQVPASIEALNGREYIEAANTVAQISHRVMLRYHADVRPKQRLLGCGGEVYEIESVIDPDGRRRQLELMCVRRWD